MKKIVFILLIVAVTSCDLLTTRNPEQPDTPANSNIPATTPDILFRNLKLSLEEKVLENYIFCFVDQSFLKKDYKFFPSAGSAAQFSVLNSWGLESEKQYFRNMKAISKPGKSITLNLLNQFQTQFGDSALYQFDYNLSLLSDDQTISGDYKGTVQFKIFLDKRNQWVIAEWSDLRIGNLRSWSELKGRLY